MTATPSRFTQIIDTLPEAVRDEAALYAQRQMNMVPGERPSDCARSAVRAYEEGRFAVKPEPPAPPIMHADNPAGEGIEVETRATAMQRRSRAWSRETALTAKIHGAEAATRRAAQERLDELDAGGDVMSASDDLVAQAETLERVAGVVALDAAIEYEQALDASYRRRRLALR